MEPKQHPQASLFSCKKVTPVLLLLLTASQLKAASASAHDVSVGEILMYVAIIVAVIAVAWIFSSRQTDKLDQQHREEAGQRKYPFPSHPHHHARRLRKKTP